MYGRSQQNDPWYLADVYYCAVGVARQPCVAHRFATQVKDGDGILGVRACHLLVHLVLQTYPRNAPIPTNWLSFHEHPW